MRFAIDAHAIGRHLTGNEVYIRSLLRGFAALDHESDFVTYFSADDARQWTAERFQARQVSPNPFVEEVPVVVCAVAGRGCAGFLVSGCAAAGCGPLDRSTDNRGADRAPITGVDP